jgi:hypothetical protein
MRRLGLPGYAETGLPTPDNEEPAGEEGIKTFDLNMRAPYFYPDTTPTMA